ncbi:hypothetical protein Ami103574_07660 [Aminipila butyrica]|uniref:Uncharacterized protein n=1 Tax=Aminipila butyrica TaxID=433296 RepID=A0A858BYR1_9FIRM|nr:hypothetical protein [Aminipila butyrica]QIB69206.1 hypothetical protein Ami103574_07660 [Aminipila butyrica]
MDEIMDIKYQREQLLEKALKNPSFMQVFYGDLEGDDDELALKNKLLLLSKSIEDFQTDVCGCGQGIRLQSMKSLIREICTYI